MTIELYSKYLKLQNASFSQIEHAEAMVASVYKVQLPSNKQLILKICSRTEDFFRETYFLNHFAGKIPVPGIIQLVQPDVGLPGAILMECLPGELLKIIDLNAELAFEIGAHLAKIHQEKTVGYGDLTQPDQIKSDPSYHFRLKFEEGLEECKNHLPNSLLERWGQRFERDLALLSSVDGPCIIHRDFRPGNLIIQAGKLQGIIDWSSARGSFAEEDFCPLELGEWPTDNEFRNALLAGYSSIRSLPHFHKIMPLLGLSRAIAVIGFTVKRGTWNNIHAKIYEKNLHYLHTSFH
jgi:Ser/Thr protein kinase RdoA (MazF antagonist)